MISSLKFIKYDCANRPKDILARKKVQRIERKRTDVELEEKILNIRYNIYGEFDSGSE